MKVIIKGLGKFNKFRIRLPKKMDRELSGGNEQWVNSVRKSAKLRAPKDTRELTESIKSKRAKTIGKTKQWKIIVESPHGIFQEEGFKPHWAPIMGSRKMAPGVYFVSKSKPFMKPALEQNIGRLSQILSNRVVRALI